MQQARPTPCPVGILGGMGPAAGASFVAQFVRACEQWLNAHGQPVCDQAFPEHWLVQAPVPDRTAALTTPLAVDPLAPMQLALAGLSAQRVQAVAIACNTAHAWHARLQASAPAVELLHIAHEAALALRAQGIGHVGLMATVGTHQAGLYEGALAAQRVRCSVPIEHEQQTVMQGIYQGVKAGQLTLAREAFRSVAESLARRTGCEALVLACTEIPLALRPQDAPRPVFDPSVLLATALAERAYRGA